MIDEWLIVFLVIFIAVLVVSQSPNAKRNKKIQGSLKKSKSYRKSVNVLRNKIIFALVSFFVLLVLGLGVLLFGSVEANIGMVVFGLILLLASFVMPLIIIFSGGVSKEIKKIQKMFKKQESKEVYQEELIKERARLQARKEYKKSKKTNVEK